MKIEIISRNCHICRNSPICAKCSNCLFNACACYGPDLQAVLSALQSDMVIVTRYTAGYDSEEYELQSRHIAPVSPEYVHALIEAGIVESFNGGYRLKEQK